MQNSEIFDLAEFSLEQLYQKATADLVAPVVSAITVNLAIQFP
jgi:hypothetical protein